VLGVQTAWNHIQQESPHAVVPNVSDILAECTCYGWMNRAGFWHRGFLRPTSYTVLRENSGNFKNNGTSLCNFVPNSALRKFRHGKSIVMSTKLVDGRACEPHERRSTRHCGTHIVYYTSVDCNPLALLLRSALDLLYNLFLHFCSSWQDFDWHSASRGPSAAAELLVSNNTVLYRTRRRRRSFLFWVFGFQFPFLCPRVVKTLAII